VDYKYPIGELFHVNIELARLGTKGTRVANVASEVTNDILPQSLLTYGNILNIKSEK
jgi:hypothetical protein